MQKIRSPLTVDDRKPTLEALQSTLIELVDLSLAGKQAHWNVVGPHFRSVHRQLDALVAASRNHADTVAERVSALGGNPDGRPETVVVERTGAALPGGYLQDQVAVRIIVDRLDAAIDRVRHDMRATEEPDPPSQDLLNDVLHDLEEQSWMFQAMVA